MAVAMASERVIAGPAGRHGAESYAAHRARLGELPRSARSGLIETLDRSGLLGRGGAGFPAGQKWRSVAARARGGAVVVANGAEGEPRSAKDRAIMTLRPHLVIDGGVLAAEAIGASELIIYVGTEHRQAVDAIARAIAERPPAGRIGVRLVEAPIGYVSGESSAVVHFLEDRDARPTTVPPRPFERGVGGRPTLVQNVETLAHVALVARCGDDWYRSAGRGSMPGTALVTVSGAVAGPGVREIEYGTPLSELLTVAGGLSEPVHAVLLGGYFGGWATVDEIEQAGLDPAALRARGLSFGCGLIHLLPDAACGVWATSQVMTYMAGESARQCGPCIFGLGAIENALRRLSAGSADDSDLADVSRWADQIAGRGACHHPDGAVGLLKSGLRVFAEEFDLHQRERRCSRPSRRARGT